LSIARESGADAAIGESTTGFRGGPTRGSGQPGDTDGWQYAVVTPPFFPSTTDGRPMVDTTSDLGEDVDPEDAPTCETCGEPIVEDPSHAVETWIEDGSVRSRHYCSEECQRAA